MKNIHIISASQKKMTESDVSILIGQTPKNLGVDLKIHYENSVPIAKVYNQSINDKHKNDILIFAHDDLIIEDALLAPKLNEALKVYDIVGLAGMKAPIAIKPPCLWHLMGNQQNMSGAVAHFAKDMKTRWMTNFGPAPERVILLDGVCLILNTEKILEKGLKFDENNPAGFHFYDLLFSLDANKLGLKLGTWPIWCTHRSHGLEKPSEDWLKGQQYLLKKYG